MINAKPFEERARSMIDRFARACIANLEQAPLIADAEPSHPADAALRQHTAAQFAIAAFNVAAAITQH